MGEALAVPLPGREPGGADGPARYDELPHTRRWHVSFDEVEGLLIRSVDLRRRSPTQTVLTTVNRDQGVFDPVMRQGPGHHHGLLVRHIRIRRAVNQQRRRIVCSHVHYGHVGVEPVGLSMGIPAGDGLGPGPELTAMLVEGTAVPTRWPASEIGGPPASAWASSSDMMAVWCRAWGLGELYQLPMRSP